MLAAAQPDEVFAKGRRMKTLTGRVGRYEIVKYLGQGGFSTVYLAKDIALDRSVALKIEKQAFRSDFGVENESRMLASLQHPAIVAVHDVGRQSVDVGDQLQELSYGVFEYMESSLELELKRSPTSLPYDRLIEIIAKIADAVDYVHRRGYLHRNIKPQVVYLDSNGLPRLSGFAVAIRQKDLEQQIAGTPRYMAPEAFSEPQSLGPQSDVWSLGVTLYQCLTGQLPFEFASLGDLTSNLSSGMSAIPPRQLVGSIPDQLESICLKCLSFKPEDRYATAGSMASALNDWQRGAVPSKRTRVFVSHSTQDREFVEKEIISLLERNGIQTWYSKVQINTSAQWERAIVQGLESCEWFLVVMSLRAAQSEWVKDELHWAIDNRPKRIIPVLIEDCEVRQFHIRMARLQYVDFRSNPTGCHNKLMEAFENTIQN
jgi:serine/threonine protein kinase